MNEYITKERLMKEEIKDKRKDEENEWDFNKKERANKKEWE